MVGTAGTPGPYDALEKSRPDEPIFTLAGRDPDAPPTITYWAHLRRNRAIKLWGDNKSKRAQKLLRAELEQCAEADKVAAEFVEWRRDEEPADEGTARATYTEVKKTEEQVAEAAARDQLLGHLRHAQEGRYHINEMREGLLALGLITEETSAEMQGWIDRLQEVADDVTPKRERPTEDDE